MGEAEKATGVLCSPCHSDADCASDGVCALADKSTEHFCTKKANSPCVNGMSPDCPSTAPMDGAAPKGIRCTSSASTGIAPRDHCFGAVAWGANLSVGCWTSPR